MEPGLTVGHGGARKRDPLQWQRNCKDQSVEQGLSRSIVHYGNTTDAARPSVASLDRWFPTVTLSVA